MSAEVQIIDSYIYADVDSPEFYFMSEQLFAIRHGYSDLVES